jgi:hypothetical protein
MRGVGREYLAVLSAEAGAVRVEDHPRVQETREGAIQIGGVIGKIREGHPRQNLREEYSQRQ